MTPIEASLECLELLGRNIGIGEGLPIIAISAQKPSWMAVAWQPKRMQPLSPPGFEAGQFEQLDESMDVYVGVSIFGPWVDGKRGGVEQTHAPIYGRFMRRTKANWRGMVAVMIDDIGDTDGRMGLGAKVKAELIGIQPTWKVQTSPHCWQYWYVLQEMETDRAICERFIDDLIKAGLTTDGTDPGMRGVSRVGRLPIGVNSKPKYGHPSPAVEGADFTGQLFTLEVLAAGLLRARALPDPRRPTASHLTNTYYCIEDVPKSYLDLAGELAELQLIQYELGAGGAEHHVGVTCPWAHTHGSKGGGKDVTGTKYFYPAEANGYMGGFYCWHGACQGRNIHDLLAWMGLIKSKYREARSTRALSHEQAMALMIEKYTYTDGATVSTGAEHGI